VRRREERGERGFNLWKCVFDLAAAPPRRPWWTSRTSTRGSGGLRHRLRQGLGLDDLHAEQKEFPNCIDDGIFILHEPDAVPGATWPVIGRDDHVVDFEITPNRPDCLCMIGLAREAAVTFGKSSISTSLWYRPPKAGGDIAAWPDVVVEDKLCLRYTARMVKT
jgi:hypothetical protein